MTKHLDSLRGGTDAKGPAFNPHGRRNVNSKSRLHSKLYSLLAILVLTLALIGVLEYVQRNLPSSDKSHFSPSRNGTNSVGSTVLQSQMSSSTKVLGVRQVATVPYITDVSSTRTVWSIQPSEPSDTATAHQKRQGPPVLVSVTNSTSTASSSGTSIDASPTTSPNNTAANTSTSSASFQNATTTDASITSSIDAFVPVVVTSTVSAAICTATATTTGCTCPQTSQSNGLPCACTVDSSATSCTCAITGVGADEVFACACPADTCTSCQCPVDSAGASSFLGGCGCPASPELEGCVCSYIAPDPSVLSQAACPQFRECNCGTNVRAQQCLLLNSTFSTTSFLVSTTSSVANFSSNTPANSISSSSFEFGFFGVGASVNQSSTSTANSPFSLVAASTAVTTSITSSPLFSSQGSTVSLTVTTIISSKDYVTPAAALVTPAPQSSSALITSTSPFTIVSTGTNPAGQLFTTSFIFAPAALASNAPTPFLIIVSNSLSTSANGQISAVPITLLATQASQLPSVVTGSSGQVFTIPTALLQTQASGNSPLILSATSATSEIPSQGGASGSVGAAGSPSNNSPNNRKVLTWSQAKTFLGGYLPVIAAKFHEMGWTAMCQHSLASSSFNPLLGQTSYEPFVTCAGSAVSWILIPFASDVIFFDTNYGCDNPNPLTPANPCWPPRMTSNGWVLRLIETILSVTAAISLILIALWFAHPHGAHNDLTSIAAVAAVASHPTVVKDFSCSAEMSASELKQTLKGKKYKLEEFVTNAGVARYGLVPAYDDTDIAQQRSANEKWHKTAKPGWLDRLHKSWQENLFYADGIFLCYLIALLAITAAYVRDVERSVFAKLFPGSTVGRRIVFAVIAAVAGMNYNRIERDTQTLAPYMSLKNLQAAPTPTILLRRHSLPLTSFLPLLRNKHTVPATVALIGIVGEFLVVSLSGLPYRPGQLKSEFLFCGITSLCILLLMVTGVVLVNVWRFSLPKLPRKPDTVSHVLTYVVGAKMCDDFEGLERLETAERDKAIKSMSKRYGYGQQEIGGQVRWIVDSSGRIILSSQRDQKGVTGRIPIEIQESAG